MAYLLTFSELSQQQIDEALDYYNKTSIELAEGFEEDLLEAYQSLKEHPQHYFNLSKGFRRINLPNFSYQLIYKIFESNNEVFIAALFHQHGDPKKIKRLK